VTVPTRPDSFGARLRQRRERQQIALTTIAEQTKIKLSHLEGLERDDLSHWPVGIFRRAFVRAYANAIGLEPAAVLKEFLALYPDPIDDAPDAFFEAPVDGTSAQGKPPTRLRFLVGSAFGSLSRGRESAIDRQGVRVDDPVVAVEVAVEAAAPSRPAPFEPDLLAAAQLCTELSQTDKASETGSLLGELARIVNALGLIIWIWDPQTAELKPALAHGYSEKVLAQLPTVKREADNATAAAFRSAHTCVVDGSDRSGALAVPLMTSGGCVGVLAIELQNGGEQTVSVRALVTMVAAQLARVIQAERPVELSDRRLA
jgi:GAF domain-containing protein